MTILFARYMGTMAGAVLAGQRAAVEVLDVLRPQSLTSQDYFLLKEAASNYNDEVKPVKKWSYSVFKWTLALPTFTLMLTWFAFKLRGQYGRLLVPLR